MCHTIQTAQRTGWWVSLLSFWLHFFMSCVCFFPSKVPLFDLLYRDVTSREYMFVLQSPKDFEVLSLKCTDCTGIQ